MSSDTQIDDKIHMTRYVSQRKELIIEDWYNRILSSKDNQYFILKHLTTSGHGEIFLAITNDNYLVCVKIFMEKKYLDFEVDTLKNFQKRLDDILLPYLDYFIIHHEDHNYYIIVMKYFEGWILLSDFSNKCLFYEEQRDHIHTKVKSIITKLHTSMIIHHDIDKRNILIHSKTLQIRLIDLGYCIHKIGKGLSEDEFRRLIQNDFDMIQNI
jgi:hypothetical protein